MAQPDDDNLPTIPGNPNAPTERVPASSPGKQKALDAAFDNLDRALALPTDRANLNARTAQVQAAEDHIERLLNVTK